MTVSVAGWVRWARWALACAAFAVVLLVTQRSFARFAPPPMQDAVTDTAGKLTAADDRALEERITAYRTRTGNEIAVLVIGSLGGETIEDVAYDTFNTWGIGKEGLDNGVLLVVAPTERRTRIETGKGVGDRLTDIDCAQILRDRVGPLLKEERFREAIEAALEAIEAALDGKGAPPLPASLLVTPLVPGAYVVDSAHALEPSAVAAIEAEAAAEGRYWARFAIVVTDDTEQPDATDGETATIAEIRARRSKIPAFQGVYVAEIILVGARDREVVSVHPSARLVNRDLTRVAKEASDLKSAIRAIAERKVAAAKQEDANQRAAARIADEKEASKPGGWIFAIIFGVVLLVPFLVLVIISFLSRKSKGGGGSSYATSSSTSSSSWSSSSSTSSTSSSSDTSYSGGGGRSGGGGASDSY